MLTKLGNALPAFYLGLAAGNLAGALLNIAILIYIPASDGLPYGYEGLTGWLACILAGAGVGMVMEALMLAVERDT